MIDSIYGKTLLSQEFRELFWEVLFQIPDESFKNGRTAAYWHLMSVLEGHLEDDNNEL